MDTILVCFGKAGAGTICGGRVGWGFRVNPLFTEPFGGEDEDWKGVFGRYKQYLVVPSRPLRLLDFRFGGGVRLNPAKVKRDLRTAV